MALFSGIKYNLASSLSPTRQSQLSIALQTNGATESPLEDATHIITNTPQFEGSHTIGADVSIVTDFWVDRCIHVGKLQNAQSYSPDPSMIFSGVVACATELPPSDLEVLSAGITALGGQWRAGLTREVTHLFAVSSGSIKYETALHFQSHTKVKVLLPHWFDDAVRLGHGSLPTAEYEWPQPRLMQRQPEESAGKVKLAAEKKSLYKSTLWTPGQDIPVHRPGQRDVWQGRRILLSPGLELTAGRREAVQVGIVRAKGAVVEFERAGGEGDAEEEARLVDEADILVTRYRSGVAYAKALRANKTIGTLSWLFHVQSTGVLTRPADQLLHYPIPFKPIESFSAHEITVTNYTGESREYLKKLINAMGAKFTPSMSGRNTVLIAAYISGNKTTKARNWSIPIVNHTWLEDCFVQWRNLTVGLEKYIIFPVGVDFSQILGERGLGKAMLDDLELELELEGAEEGEVGAGVPKTVDKGPVVTEMSARDAREVEGVVGLLDEDGDAFMGGGGGDEDNVPINVDSQSPRLKPKSTAKPLSKPVTVSKPVSQKKGKAKAPSPEDDIIVVEQVRHKTASPKKYGSSSKARRVYESPEDSDDADGLVADKPARESRPSGRHEQNETSGRQEGRLGKSTSEEEVVEVLGKPGPSTRKRKAPPLSENEDPGTEVDIDVTPSVTISPSKRGPKPKRVMSVVVPHLAAALSPPKASGDSPPKDTPKSPRKAALRTESLHITVNEASSSKRDRPTAVSPSSVRMVTPKSTPVSDQVRASSKRSAATRATQRLHEEIMPDVLNYQQEMRKDAKAKGRERTADRSREIEVPSRRRKRPSDVHSALSSDDEVQTKKARVSFGLRKGKKAASSTVDDESESESPSKRGTTSDGEGSPTDHREPVRKTAARTGGTSSGSRQPQRSNMNTRTIKLMTTQVTLSDNVIKVLTKLGVKIITKPSECTHLIVPHLVRTEKFLCALAVSPFILSEKWAVDSAAAKEILPEKDYFLRDPENEKKYNFKLSDAIRRAKETSGGLFANKTFYVTPKVPVDMKLLKNIVAAGGGQISQQVPTARILGANENRHVISCPADTSIWRPLVQHHHPVYTQELILTGALRQDVDWEDESFRVPNSY